MKAIQTADAIFGKGPMRADGRKLRPTCLSSGKTPEESTDLWECHNPSRTNTVEEAWFPLAEGGCPYIKA